MNDAEQTANYGTSHQFLDDFALAYHRRVAEILLSAPDEVLEFAAQRQRRRYANTAFGSGEYRAFAAWDDVLRLAPVDIAGVITDASERGQQLRQSSPFAGLLSESERLELLEFHEERARRFAESTR